MKLDEQKLRHPETEEELHQAEQLVDDEREEMDDYFEEQGILIRQ